MTASLTPKLRLFLGLAGVALVGGLLLGRVELIALAAPPIVAATTSLASTRRPEVRATLEVEMERCLEGDEFELRIGLACDDRAEEVEVGVRVPATFALVEGNRQQVLSIDAQEPATVTLRLRALRWGVHVVGPVAVRVNGPGRLMRFERVFALRQRVRVYPPVQRLRRAIRPPNTQALVGNYVARAAAAGIEFASVRPFAPGDDVRRLNWSVSSRRDDLYVNVHHPERNAEVVLLLDSFADVGEAGSSSLDVTVRAAFELCRHYLDRKDRVGLVGMGGVLRWLTPAMGRTQFLRIADYLLETRAVFSYAWRDTAYLPKRTLPAGSLVIALTPLADSRVIRALADLRARGFALVVLDTLTEAAIGPGPTPEQQLSHRLWRLQRAATRAELADRGVPTLKLESRNLDVVLAQMGRWERTKTGTLR
ncbi:MAG: DUF58 domain-containing protein [Actinomycetota bacterium]